MRQLGATADDVVDVTRGLHWYCARHHTGPRSPEYQMLSVLKYTPGRYENHVPYRPGMARTVYVCLTQHYLELNHVYEWIQLARESERV